MKKQVICILTCIIMAIGGMFVVKISNVQAAPKFRIVLDKENKFDYAEDSWNCASIDWGNEKIDPDKVSYQWSVPKDSKKYLSIDDEDYDKEIVYYPEKAGTPTLQCKVTYNGKIYNVTTKVPIKQANALKSAKIGNENYVKDTKKSFSYLVAYTNAKSAKISFQANKGWKIKKITSGKQVLKNNKTIKISPKKSEFIFDVYMMHNSTKDKVSYEFRIRKYVGKQLIYGKPKNGTVLTITDKAYGEKNIIEAKYKKKASNKIKETGSKSSGKLTFEFKSKKDLVKKLNIYLAGKAKISKKGINLKLFKYGNKWTIKVKKGHGMKVK